MAGGYAGKVLFVDLNKGVIKEEAIPERTYRDFIGGYGLGIRIPYKKMKPGIDPLDPDNMLGFDNICSSWYFKRIKFQFLKSSLVDFQFIHLYR